MLLLFVLFCPFWCYHNTTNACFVDHIACLIQCASHFCYDAMNLQHENAVTPTLFLLKYRERVTYVTMP